MKRICSSVVHLAERKGFVNSAVMASNSITVKLLNNLIYETNVFWITYQKTREKENIYLYRYEIVELLL
jgi:hypothetical protein